MPRPMTTFRALSGGGQLCLLFVCCCLMDHRSRLAATAQASGAWLTTVAQSRPAPQDCPSLHVGFRLRLFAVLSRARRKALCPLVLSSLLADHQVWRQRRARLGPAPSSPHGKRGRAFSVPIGSILRPWPDTRRPFSFSRRLPARQFCP